MPCVNTKAVITPGLSSVMTLDSGVTCHGNLASPSSELIENSNVGIGSTIVSGWP